MDSTAVASHEVIEAATDPDSEGYALPSRGPKPWKDDVWNAFDLTGHAELGDLCEGTFYWEGGHLYQRVWSNAAAAAGGDPCIPEIRESFYDTTFEHDWYAVEPGDNVSIPVTGWSTGPVSDWGLEVRIQPAAGYDVRATPDTLNSGRTARIDVRAPADATSGTFAILNVESTRPARTSMTDGAHVNVVGVYIP